MHVAPSTQRLSSLQDSGEAKYPVADDDAGTSDRTSGQVQTGSPLPSFGASDKVSDDGKYNSLSFLSNAVCTGKHCWTVILREDPSLVIGGAPTSSDQTATRNCDQSGWYISSVDGSLWSGPPFNYRNVQLSGREQRQKLEKTNL